MPRDPRFWSWNMWSGHPSIQTVPSSRFQWRLGGNERIRCGPGSPGGFEQPFGTWSRETIFGGSTLHLWVGIEAWSLDSSYFFCTLILGIKCHLMTHLRTASHPLQGSSQNGSPQPTLAMPYWNVWVAWTLSGSKPAANFIFQDCANTNGCWLRVSWPNHYDEIPIDPHCFG